MRSLLYTIIGTMLIFGVMKCVYMLSCKLINFVAKKRSIKVQYKFDIGISMGFGSFMVFAVYSAIVYVAQHWGFTTLEFYISFCLMGICSVIWCYFSWDAEKFFVKPHIATVSQCKRKKL